MNKHDSFWTRITEAQKAAQFAFEYIWDENGIVIPCDDDEDRMRIISGLIFAGIRSIHLACNKIKVMEDEDYEHYGFYLS